MINKVIFKNNFVFYKHDMFLIINILIALKWFTFYIVYINYVEIKYNMYIINMQLVLENIFEYLNQYFETINNNIKL
jgi:hypothetical protein